MQPRKIKIHKVFLIYMVFISFISIFSVGYLWILSEWSRFEEETTALRASYLDTQQKLLKREVDQALSFVKYMRSQTDKQVRSYIKGRVYEAYSIAETIFKQYKDSKSTAEIQKIIKDTLRPIRFSNDRGYYFAFSLDGIQTLSPARPETEGKNMLQFRGGKGEPVVLDMLTVIREQGEGFYAYNGPKSKERKFLPEIVFVKLFEPIDLVIGTGEYSDDIEKNIQEKCLSWISNINFGKEGYVFAGQWDGLSLSGPATGKNMYDIQDIHGVKIVQELIKAAKAGGGFVHYVLPKFKEKKNVPKISYAAGIDKWQWYLGSGVYVDEIETEIAIKQSKLDKRIKSNIRNACFILISLLAFIVLLGKLLSNKIRDNFKLFTTFFNRATSGAVKIESDMLHFSEFIKLAESANEMVDNRKRAEESEQESEKRFRALHDASFGGIAIYDKGIILDCNQGLSDMTGFALKELLGMNGLDLIAQDWREFVMQKILTGYEEPYEVEGLRKDGTKYHLRIQGKNIPYRGDTVRVTEFRDITETKRLQNHLMQAQKMEAIGTLAGGIAHDFNNILGAILGYAQLAQLNSAENPKVQRYIDQLCLASERAKGLVQQILAFSRQSKSEKMPIDIGVVIKEALKLLRASIPSTIEIRQNVKSNLSAVEADQTQIHQVIMNLCTNAFHSMETEGGQLDVDLIPIKISTEDAAIYQDIKPGHYLKLTVADTGYGMSADTVSRIFEPYFTTKEVGEGTGMGLATVHGIVKSYGGDIKVHSEPGAGTSFHILFPTIEIKAEKTIEESISIPGGNEKILFVDDEKYLLDIGKDSLERLGYKVETRNSAYDALEAFRIKPDKYDLLITDMTMPKMTGEKLAAEIKKIRPDIPIILCTGYSKRMSPENAREMGMSSILMKPLTLHDLANTVRRVLDEKQG